MGKIIAIDFDGTCVTNDFPKIGKTVPNCLEVLRELLKNNHRLILWTVRDKQSLKESIEWFAENKIKLYGINNNPSQTFSNSRKIYYDFLIDDRSLGCPLVVHKSLSPKPFVNWEEIRKFLQKEGVL